MKLSFAVALLLLQGVPSPATASEVTARRAARRKDRALLLQPTPQKLLTEPSPRLSFPTKPGALKNHRKVSEQSRIECDPDQETDVGILECGGAAFYCMESEASSLGGFCSLVSKETRSSRGLDETLFLCANCDCSGIVNGTGTIDNCLLQQNHCQPFNPDLSIPEFCYSQGAFATYDSHELQSFTYCYNVTKPYERVGCYSYTYDDQGTLASCELKIDGVTCNACTLVSDCPDSPNFVMDPHIFDCTNTAIRRKGNNCDGDYLMPYKNSVFDDPPTSAPVSVDSSPTRTPIAPPDKETTDLPTGMPITTGLPSSNSLNKSSVETPAPSTDDSSTSNPTLSFAMNSTTETMLPTLDPTIQVTMPPSTGRPRDASIVLSLLVVLVSTVHYSFC